MPYKAQSKQVKIGGTEMDYVVFGGGKRPLVILPGLGDGLETVKGTGKAIALLYHHYADDYRAYIFSRKNKLKPGCTIRDMAADQKEALDILGIANIDLIGISQGGMIAQCMALDYPDLIGRLVLVVTTARQNATAQQAIGKWKEMAVAGDYSGIFIDTSENSYTEAWLKKERLLYPLLQRVKKAWDTERYVIMADSALTFDVYGEIEKIACPTFIIGAENDQILGKAASQEIAAKIPGSKLYIYPQYGHGVYAEAKDFGQRVLKFLQAGG
jgi:pimeloyl-ACP methyl ester carboxylesterase